MGRAHTIPTALVLAALASSPSATNAAEPYAELSLGSEATSNVYLDDGREWDFSLVPRLAAGLAFGRAWSVDYEGEVDIFVRHKELFFQRHELGLSVEPTWGEDGGNSFFASLSLAAQNHADAFESIDHVAPSLSLGLTLEPRPWFRFELTEEISYRAFYNDVASDSLDAWSAAAWVFTLPSRTTLAPRFAYGYRHYPRQDLAVTSDTADHQLAAGLHGSQAVGEHGGLSVDYEYLHNIGQSGLIARKLTSTEFSYLGEEFLFTGHRVELAYKQLFESGWSFGLGARFEARTYDGWVIESSGSGSGGGGSNTEREREDIRLGPNGFVAYRLTPREDASPAAPELSVELTYAYLRQWSNDKAFDTDRHTGGLRLTLAW